MSRDLELSQVTAAALSHVPLLPRRLLILVATGPDQGQSLELVSGSYVVGKGSTCSFRLTDPQVSRRHLEVQVTEGGLVLRDLGSKNGCFLAGVRFTEVVVGMGAVIRVGATELKFVSPEGASALPPSQATSFGRLIGKSLRMREVYGLLERIAPTQVPVLISGETGTGKELCAEALHQASKVQSGPFVVCDIAGLPRTLIESELFGHVRGAFTGADRDREGAFVRANRGTIFIDEIGELEIGIQPRLLRVLEQRQVKPVGASGYQKVDIRIISATNRDLKAECAAARFREDLFHRLSVVQVVMPPLRERKEDIPDLVASWLPKDVTATAETLGLLMEHDWPGNARELRNVVERGLSLLAGATELTPAYLGLSTTSSSSGAATAPATASGDYKQAKENLIATWERSFVQGLLKKTGGNISAAAREGGLDRAYLHRLMRKYGIRGEG
jgi:DNA-binding NtrC family response regulator